MKTIQGIIEDCIKDIFKISTINLIGSGRTDSGVHARNQCANIFLNTSMNTDQIKKALNSKLPTDIFIKECSIVSDDFHSRFSATKREYLYYINYDNCPFKRLYSWNCKWLFDKDKLKESSKLLLGKHDFSLFSKASSETKNKFCNIECSEWAFENGQAIYNIHADRFLQHMVRLLVGTMIEVGRGRIPLDDFLNMIHCKKTKFHSVRAPGEGLFLSSIQYD